MNSEKPQEDSLPDYIDGLPVREIVIALKSIRYGDVRIVVQDSKVVQIDKTEKTRLDDRFGLSPRKPKRKGVIGPGA